MSRKISIFAYSQNGCAAAMKIRDVLQEEEIRMFAPQRIIERVPEAFEPIPKAFRQLYGEMFGCCEAMIFVGACGIAVREIAPFIKSKKTDPAVICVDDKMRFVIPVLSGHIGGANELAAMLAGELDAVPVITTATDISGKFSVDTWAARNGYVIGSMKAAKQVSAEILEHDIPLLADLPVEGALPPGVYLVEEAETSENASCGIYIGWERKNPFPVTLALIPKCLHLGIGCRKGTPEEEIEKAVAAVVSDHGLDRRAFKKAASVDLKKEETGLLAWCGTNGLPVSFYSSGELKKVEGSFSSSEFVQSITGVDNVCERSAMIGADRLIVKKTAFGKVTVAVAAELPEVNFS